MIFKFVLTVVDMEILLVVTSLQSYSATCHNLSLNQLFHWIPPTRATLTLLVNVVIAL